MIGKVYIVKGIGGSITSKQRRNRGVRFRGIFRNKITPVAAMK